MIKFVLKMDLIIFVVVVVTVTDNTVFKLSTKDITQYMTMTPRFDRTLGLTLPLLQRSMSTFYIQGVWTKDKF